MRVQVNLSEEVVEQVDEMAKSYGVSRSALISVWVGQIVYATNKTLNMAKETVDKVFEE